MSTFKVLKDVRIEDVDRKVNDEVELSEVAAAPFVERGELEKVVEPEAA